MFAATPDADPRPSFARSVTAPNPGIVVIPAAILLAGLTLAGAASAQGVEDPTGSACVAAQDDASCEAVAVSGTGDATCRAGFRGVCLAVSGTGNASASSFEGEAASVSLTGDATCANFEGDCEAIDGDELMAGAIARTGCVPHPAIEITEEHGSQGFTWTNPITGETEHRPGSGVVAGNGTAGNPYVIEGWCITPINRVNGIHIQGTDAHVVVQANVVDGAESVREHGIVVEGARNVTLQDNHVSRAHFWGIHLVDANRTIVEDNTVVGSGLDGIVVESSRGAVVAGNTVADSRYFGIWVPDSDGVVIRGNEVSGNTYAGIRLGPLFGDGGPHDTVIRDNEISHTGGDAIHLFQSPGTTLEGNTLRDNVEGIFVEDSPGIRAYGNAIFGGGFDLVLGEDFGHEIGPSNTVNGEPVRYHEDAANVTVEAPAGQVILVETSNATVRDLTLSGTSIGLQVLFSENATVTGNTIADNTREGIYVLESGHPTIANNTITDNDAGAILSSAPGARIVNNTVTDNDDNGVDIKFASGSTIANNTVSENGIWGIQVSDAGRSTIANNTVTGNDHRGVQLLDSSRSRVADNTVTNNNDIGVAVFRSDGVRIASNNIASNSGPGLQVGFDSGTVDATDNWWGAASGPSGGVTDACTGTVADGDGQAIVLEGGEVCFEPWRTSPNPEAGVQGGAP